MDHLTQSDKSRSFVCSCGKDYLSYPALFTHIKQKHDGKVYVHSCRLQDLLKGPDLTAREEGQEKMHLIHPLTR